MSVSPIANSAVALPRSASQTYTVKRGDTLSGIAEKLGVSLAALEAANPQIDNPNLIHPGQTVDIPEAGDQRMHAGPEKPLSGQDGNKHAASTKAASAAKADKAPSTVQGRINQGMGYFMSQGWSRAQAAGIMANLYYESGRTLDPHQQQIGGGPGYGIAQWGYPRQAQFEQVMGVNMHSATYGQELKFVQWELSHTEKNAANKLRATNNAFDAGVAFCRYYERPAQSYQPERGRIAQNIYKDSDPTQGPGPAPSPTPSPSPAPAPSPSPSAHDYTVRRGDTMSSIASRNGVSLSALERANPQISNPDRIYVGQTIHIPGKGGGESSKSHDYTVRRGDTMSSIASRNGVSLSALERANPQISNPNRIYVGQTIHIPGKGGGKSSSKSHDYTVRRGDTMSGIASRNGVSLSALERANPQIGNPNLIHIGQTIHIPGKGGGKSSSKTHNYTVQRGDTMSGIASRNGVSLSALERANPQIGNPNRINVGQTIHIPGSGSSGPVHGSGHVGGTNAAAKAHHYLGRYESDLQRAGVTLNCPTSESCANFVTSMLIQSGEFSSGQMSYVQRVNVHAMSQFLKSHGWHVVPASQAKPGDVWVCDGAHGESHTELVDSNHNGRVTLIGSNNHPRNWDQQINRDTYSATIGGSYILAPPN